MASKKYGSKHSPDTGSEPKKIRTSKFRNQPVERVSARAKLLYWVPIPLFFSTLGEIRQGDLLGTVTEGSAFLCLSLSAWLLNEGIRAESHYNAKKIARPPAFPRKATAAVFAAMGVFLAAYFGAGKPLLEGVGFALIAGIAHIAAFGLDPMKKKGLEGQNEFETERVARAVEKGEAMLKEMVKASERFNDPPLEARVKDIAQSARDVFRALEEDPRDLPRARKFLSVYLMGARDATIKFANIHQRKNDPKVKSDYEALLVDLQGSFDNQRAKLLLEDRTDLDIEIEVLRERLQRDGVKIEIKE